MERRHTDSEQRLALEIDPGRGQEVVQVEHERRFAGPFAGAVHVRVVHVSPGAVR